MIKKFFSFPVILLIAAYAYLMYYLYDSGAGNESFSIATIGFFALLAFLLLAKLVSKIFKIVIVLALVAGVGFYAMKNGDKNEARPVKAKHHKTNN